MGNDQSGGCAGDCELAGTWVPIRHGEWTNRMPGMAHSARAKMPATKMTYNWDGKGKNLVLITHYSIITAVTNAVPSSGEIIIINKDFVVINTIATD